MSLALLVGVATGWFGARQSAAEPGSDASLAAGGTTAVALSGAVGVPPAAGSASATGCETARAGEHGTATAPAAGASSAPAAVGQETPLGAAPMLVDATREASPPDPPTFGSDSLAEELVAGQILPPDQALVISAVAPETEAIELEVRLAAERGAEVVWTTEGDVGLPSHEKR